MKKLLVYLHTTLKLAKEILIKSNEINMFNSICLQILYRTLRPEDEKRSRGTEEEGGGVRRVRRRRRKEGGKEGSALSHKTIKLRCELLRILMLWQSINI